MQGKVYGLNMDIWSFSAIVYEMFTIEPPYHELNTPAAMFQIVTQEMELKFPRRSSNICMSFTKSCFQKTPEDRPSAKYLLSHRFVSFWNDS